MSKKSFLLSALTLLALLTFSQSANAETDLVNSSLYDRLKGRIILNVESKGEAYYISPTKKEMYFLSDPKTAFQVMIEQGIGIKNSDLEKIGIASSDKSGTDSRFANLQKGKMFLQVEEKGEAWYVSPSDAKRYFLGSPSDAFAIMKKLGLGVNSEDFNKILDPWNDELLSYQDDKLKIKLKYANNWILANDKADAPSWLTEMENNVYSILLYKKSISKNYVSNFPLDATIRISTVTNPNNLSLQEIFDKEYQKRLDIEKESIAKGDDPGFGVSSRIDVSLWKAIKISSFPALQSGRKIYEGSRPIYSTYIQVPNRFIVISGLIRNDELENQLADEYNIFINHLQILEKK